MAQARCVVAEAEIALVSRDLGGRLQALGAARSVLEAHGDSANAAHAGYLDARRLLLVGRLEDCERTLGGLDFASLPRASQPGYWLVVAGVAIRQTRAGPARAALDRAENAARQVGISALISEVERARAAFEAPAARLVALDRQSLLRLADVEALLASGALVVDARRYLVSAGEIAISFASRPVLFALALALAEAAPEDVSRDALVARAFRGREADESHRARLRVEIGRLRKMLAPLASLQATRRGFLMKPRRATSVAALAPPLEGDHAELLALLADGEAWATSALALALDISPRTVQRALEALQREGKAELFGRGRACRWMAPNVPGFPTSLLLPGSAASG